MSRNRNIQVKVYLDEEERAKLQDKIIKSKLSQSDYIRKAILEKDIIVIEDLREVYVELKKIGNNINQMAKIINSGNVTDTTKIVEYKKHEFDQVFNELKRILKKV